MRASTVLIGLSLAHALAAPVQAEMLTGNKAFGTWKATLPV